MILSIVNNKGGVGKTTTAINLAAGLAAKKKKVLLVDLDSQSASTFSLGCSVDEGLSLADVLTGESSPLDAIRQTSVANLSLLPGSFELVNVEMNLKNIRGRENVLSKRLQEVRNLYEYIIIDSPPSMSLLTLNGLIAADYHIVPVVPVVLSLQGLVHFLKAVERIKEGLGIELPRLGILLTKVDYRVKVTTEIIEMIREHYSDTFKTEIRTNIRLAESPSFGETIFQYDDRSTGAESYKKLTNEVLRKIKNRGEA